MQVALIALLLFAGLFIGTLIVIVFLAVNAKTTGGRVGVILAGVILLMSVPLVLLTVSWVSYRSVEVDRQRPAVRIEHQSTHSDSSGSAHEDLPAVEVSPDLPIAPPNPLPKDDNRAPGVWQTTASGSFQANVYPSCESAVRSMFASLRNTLIENRVLTTDEQGDVVDPKGIHVSVSGAIPDGLISPASDLTKQFPDTVVRVESEKPAIANEDDLLIHLDFSAEEEEAPWDRGTRWGGGKKKRNGELICRVASKERSTSLRCFVTEKPWVESFDRFVSLYPNRRFVVGYSREFSSSESEARKAALEDAVRQAPLTLDGKSYGILDDRHVLDRFAQRLTRSYGDVWREAVLVEVPEPAQIDAARMSASDAFRLWTLKRVSRSVGIGILLVLVMVLCLMLNWVTKGYYRGQVLIVLLGVVFVGCFITVMFIS